MEQPLTAHEAADELGYHITYLYRLLKNGTVQARQFNRVWMIDRAEVERVKELQGQGGRLRFNDSHFVPARTNTCVYRMPQHNANIVGVYSAVTTVETGNHQ